MSYSTPPREDSRLTGASAVDFIPASSVLRSDGLPKVTGDRDTLGRSLEAEGGDELCMKLMFSSTIEFERKFKMLVGMPMLPYLG